MHHKFRTERRHIINSLDDGDADDQKRANKLENCCATPMLAWSDTGTMQFRAIRCKQRACPLCSLQRSQETAKRAERAVSEMDRPKLLTLTVRSTDEPLRDQLKTIRAWFRKLRNTKAWKSRVESGIYGIETTWNNNTQQWHPHIHVIIDSAYYEKQIIVNDWTEITNGSCIVDIRPCYSRKQAARYITKYVTKTSGLSEWPPEQVREWTQAMHGQRLLATLGTLHGTNLSPKDENDKAELFPHLISISLLQTKARQGCEAALRLVMRAIIAKPSTTPIIAADVVERAKQRINPGELRKSTARHDVDEIYDQPPDRKPTERQRRSWRDQPNLLPV